MVFTNDSYKKLLNILNSLSKLATDIQIVKGKISQMGKTVTHYMYLDLNSITTFDEDISLYNIENMLPLLKQFKDSTKDITLSVSDGLYTITDGISKLKIRVPNLGSFDSPYNETLRKDCSGYNKYVEFNLDKVLVKRLSNCASSMKSDKLEITSDTKTASLSLSTQNKNVSIDILTDVEVYKSFSKTTMNFDCFTDGCVGDNVKIEVYENERPSTSLIVMTTELEGCYAEFRQVRTLIP